MKSISIFSLVSIMPVMHAAEKSVVLEKKEKNSQETIQELRSELKKTKVRALRCELDVLYGDAQWPQRWAKIKEELEKDDTLSPDDIRFGTYGSDSVTANYRWPLFEAVNYQDQQAVKFLLEHKARADAVVPQGGSLLFIAEKAAIAQLLLDYKADVTVKNKLGWHESILEFVTAIGAHEPELIPLYVAHGADPKIVTQEGKSLLHILLEDCAILAKDFEICKKKARYLVAAGVPLNANYNGETVIERLQHNVEHGDTPHKRHQSAELLDAIQKEVAAQEAARAPSTT